MSNQIFHTPLEPHPSLYIYPPFFSVHKSDHTIDPSQYQVVYKYQPNWVTVTRSGKFPHIKHPINLPLNQYPGTHQHHKIVKISSRGEYIFYESLEYLKTTQGNESSILAIIPTLFLLFYRLLTSDHELGAIYQRNW